MLIAGGDQLADVFAVVEVCQAQTLEIAVDGICDDYFSASYPCCFSWVQTCRRPDPLGDIGRAGDGDWSVARCEINVALRGDLDESKDC